MIAKTKLVAIVDTPKLTPLYFYRFPFYRSGETDKDILSHAGPFVLCLGAKQDFDSS